MTQCEGWRRTGGAFTLGNPVWSQCPNEATAMVTVIQEGKEVTLPACDQCHEELYQNRIQVVKYSRFAKRKLSIENTKEDPGSAWRQRPAGPGIYVCYPGLSGSKDLLCAVCLSESDIKEGAPHGAEWCYGPIERPET